MKTLILYYSRTNITKKVCEEAAKKLKCDIEEITDPKKRDGALGFIKCGRESTLKVCPSIDDIESNIEKYDMIIFGTPNWAGTFASPIRTFLTENKAKIKNYSILITHGGGSNEKAFVQSEEILGKKAKFFVEIKAKEVKNGEYAEKLGKFLKNF